MWRFVSLLYAITTDGLRTQRTRAILIFGTGLIGMLFAGTSIGVIIGYTRLAERQESISLANRTLTADGRVETILIVATLVGTLGLLSATLLYQSQRILLRATREYYQTCLQRVLDAAAAPGSPLWAERTDLPANVVLRQMIGAASRFTAFTFRDALQSLLPTTTLIVALFALLWTEPVLSLAVLVIFTVYLVPTYLLNHRAHGYQRDYFDYNAKLRRQLFSGAQEAFDRTDDSDSRSDWAARALVDSGIDPTLNAYFGRVLSDRRVQWLNSLLLITGICLIFGYYATLIQRGDRGWSQLLLYIAALQFSVASLRPISSALIRLSRFHAKAAWYRRIIEASNDAQRLLMAVHRQSPSDDLPASGVDIDGRPTQLLIPRDGTLAVISGDARSSVGRRALPWRLAGTLRSQDVLGIVRSEMSDLPQTTSERVSEPEERSLPSLIAGDRVEMIERRSKQSGSKPPTAVIVIPFEPGPAIICDWETACHHRERINASSAPTTATGDDHHDDEDDEDSER